MAGRRLILTTAERTSFTPDLGDWVYDSDSDLTYQGTGVDVGGVLVSNASVSSGFESYADLATQTVPIVVPVDTWTMISNDGLGPQTYLDAKPAGVTRLLDTSTGELDLSELSKDDEVMVRYDLILTPSASGAFVQVRGTFGSASPFELTSVLGTLGPSGDYPFIRTSQFYIGADDMRLNPVGFEIHSSKAATLVNNGVYISITRT